MSTVLIAGGGTGGHLMPALAIAAALRDAGRRVVLVGAERGLEKRVLPTRDFPFHLLPAEPIYRSQWWKNARWPLLAFRLIGAVDRILAEEKPALVFGTGGYAAGPVVWRAASRGLPTAILEQDAFPGLTTRWLARRVGHVYMGQPETAHGLRFGAATQHFVTGCPIIPPDESLRATAHERLGLDRSKPVVLITGGGQGALAVNRVVAQWLEAGLAANCQIVWATGGDNFGEFSRFHAPPGVTVAGFLDPIAPAYAAADVAITRGGMMTISELCAWGLPGIIVPLPTAAADHQTRNAEVMARAGAAIHLPQSELTVERLAGEVSRILDGTDLRARISAAARARARPGATAEIRGHLEALEVAG